MSAAAGFHVYITLRVPPERLLAKASIAVQVYSMQSLVNGSHSLLNGIRRGFKAREMLERVPPKDRHNAVVGALKASNELPVSALDPNNDRWKKFVTLLPFPKGQKATLARRNS